MKAVCPFPSPPLTTMAPNTTPPPPPHHHHRHTPQPSPQAPVVSGVVVRARHTSTTTRTTRSPPFLLLLSLILLLPRISCFTDPSFPPHRLSYESYAHEVWLEDSGAFVVQWTPRQDDIEFRVIARTTGYLGFGLSSKPRMEGADIVVG